MTGLDLLALQGGAGNAAVGRLIDDSRKPNTASLLRDELETARSSGLAKRLEAERREKWRRRFERLEHVPDLLSRLAGRLSSPKADPDAVIGDLQAVERTLRQTEFASAAGRLAMARAVLETLKQKPEEVLAEGRQRFASANDLLEKARSSLTVEIEPERPKDPGRPKVQARNDARMAEGRMIEEMIARVSGCISGFPKTIGEADETAFVRASELLNARLSSSQVAAGLVASAQVSFRDAALKVLSMKRSVRQRLEECALTLDATASVVRRYLMRGFEPPEAAQPAEEDEPSLPRAPANVRRPVEPPE